MTRPILMMCLLAGATASVALAANPAHASTYNLTLTDSSVPAASGTGVLNIVGTPTTGQYCLGASCTPGDTLTSLSFTVDGHTFSTSLPGATGVSATFTAGVLTALGFDQAVGGNFQFHMPAGGNLQYSFQEYSGPIYYTTGLVTSATLITNSQSATPLPGALPLFASGLGVAGLVARLRKRKAAAVAA
jgi:hypothetical protein